MIKATMETKVILELSLEDAKTLSSLAPNIGYTIIKECGGCHGIATKGAKLFEDISKTLKEVL